MDPEILNLNPVYNVGNEMCKQIDITFWYCIHFFAVHTKNTCSGVLLVM